eukprot:scaffold24646_cov48-Phaeocystis_antarctica.AAC.3
MRLGNAKLTPICSEARSRRKFLPRATRKPRPRRDPSTASPTSPAARRFASDEVARRPWPPASQMRRTARQVRCGESLDAPRPSRKAASH